MSTVDSLRCSVLVGNVPFHTSEEQLKDIFSQIGPVVNFKFLYDQESGKPKGLGVCEYRDPEMALSAIRNLNGYEFKGRPLFVDSVSSEKGREELKNLQGLTGGGLSLDGSQASAAETEKAPEAISKAVASLPSEQMFELMKQMKMCIQNNPSEARNLLLQNPQLAYALLQAQVVMRIVDPQVSLNILNRTTPNPNVTTSSARPTQAEPVKTIAFPSSGANKTMPAAVLPPSIPVSSSHPDSSISNQPPAISQPLFPISVPPFPSRPHINLPINERLRNMMPPQFQKPGDGREPSGPMEAPKPSPAGLHNKPFPGPQRDPFGPFGDPRTLGERDMRMPPRSDQGDPRTLGERDMRMPPQGDLGDGRMIQREDKDMRQPPPINVVEMDMRQPMGDQDFRMMRGPQMMDNRPFDPRLRSMWENLRPGPPQHGQHPFDPRTAHEARPSGPPKLEDPRTAAMRANARGGAPVSSSATSALQGLPMSNARPSNSIVAAANSISPHDREKATLIMQVLQLSDEQIAVLPPGQQQSIIILKEQIARGGQP